MTSKRSDSPEDEVCTTQRAAEILGVSVSSVQQLVEAGIIEAWKTKGGHRRIPLHAVLRYKASPQSSKSVRPGNLNDGPVSVLVVEDNPMQRAIYERQFASWGLPVSLTFCENGYQALMEIARRQPHVLLADIVMEGIDGYEVIKTVLADPELAHMHVAMLSGLNEEELGERGGVPPGVVFFRKPINYDELRGYIKACCAQQARRNQLDG